MQIIDTFYWDMDGVLANMHGAFVHLSGGRLPHECTPKEFWGFVAEADKRKAFFENLAVMPDAYEIMYTARFYVKEDQVLTSAGREGTDWHLQKERWIRREISETIPFNFVRRGIDKAQYARPTALLIDDKDTNCDAFRAAGGHAILHRNAFDTSVELLRLEREGLLLRKVWRDGRLQPPAVARA